MSLIDKELADEIDEITEEKTRDELIRLIEKQAVIIKQLRSSETELATDLQPTCDQLATDCVSRQAALLSLDDEITITGIENAYAVRDYVRRVKRKLKSLPAAEPQIIRCKDCKHEFYCCNPCRNAYEDLVKTFKFCPNCGADMREGEKDG